MREYKLAINGNDYTVAITSVTDEEVVAEVNGETHVVAIHEIINLRTSLGSAVLPGPTTSATAGATGASGSPAGGATLAKPWMIVAPIPGHIIELCVSEGEKVLAGQKLLVLEAMKLENAITTLKGGVVKKIMVSEGDAVTHGQNMIEIG